MDIYGIHYSYKYGAVQIGKLHCQNRRNKHVKTEYHGITIHGDCDQAVSSEVCEIGTTTEADAESV